MGLFNSPIPRNYQKKIGKVISKKFDVDKYTLGSDEVCNQLVVGNKISGEIFTIDSDFKKEGYLYFNSIKTCKVGGCTVESDLKSNAAYEFFDLAIFLDTNLNIVEIKILKYFSEYGYEITSKSYLKKFYKKSPCQLKESSNIDGISGATISANSLIDEIHQLCL